MTFQEMMSQEREEGRKEGLKEGLEKGLEEGREEGQIAAWVSAMKKIMEKYGVTVEEAADILDIPEERRSSIIERLEAAEEDIIPTLMTAD